MNSVSKYSLLSLLFTLLCLRTDGQQLSINTKKIDQLIAEWNYIHNEQLSERFQNVYDDELLFYTENVPREKATLLKKLLFVRNPQYNQRIASDIKHSLYKNGIVKCEFTREISKNGE